MAVPIQFSLSGTLSSYGSLAVPFQELSGISKGGAMGLNFIHRGSTECGGILKHSQKSRSKREIQVKNCASPCANI